MVPHATRERVEGMLDVGRWRTLLMLGAHGPAKAQTLAKHTRLSARETLEHLKMLQELGVAERDLDSPQDRWAHWQVIRGGFDITDLADSDDRLDQQVYLQWLDTITQHQLMALGDWRRDWDGYPAPIRALATSEERILVRMSEDDMRELHGEIEDLVQRWHLRVRRNLEAPQADVAYRPVFLFAHMFPLDRSPSDD